MAIHSEVNRCSAESRSMSFPPTKALDFAAYQGDLDFDADLQIKS
ncbi:hypothetical protein I541_5595 [Mycobacteroides abscessus]|nr:hypothetical protein I541_5595 [Mycobacteroides abscessus]